MASAFNLTAEINLRGPSNLSKVVSDIRRQLSTVTLDLNINPRSLSSIQQATGNIQSLNAALKSASTNAANLNTALSNLGTAIGNASRGMNNLGGGVNNIANQVNNARKSTAQITSQMEEFGKQSALAVRRFAAFSVATGGIYALSRAVASAYGEFLNFNKELVKLQQVTGATENGLKGITNEITRLSTSLGVTSSDLLTVSSTLAQAGLSATETKTALEALAKSALAPSFDNLNDTVEGSIALMRQFGISASDLESSLGSVNAVAAAFAVESGDIIKAIQRTGGVFAAASKGVSQGKDALNEFIAVFTSVRQTTRESAETIATGLRTIFTRIQRGSTIEALKEYGVVLTDLEGKFVGPYEAIRRLSEGLKLLDPRDLRFNKIVEELGGFRQIGKVIPLIQQFTVAQQALGVAQRGAGSLAEDAAIAQISLANKITKVREEFIALIRDIGQSKNFQRFVDISLQLASALISVASAAKEVLPAIAALTAIKAIPAIGQFVGGFGRNIARKNDGGPVRAFASGGYVPGSGNRDTVPAMLTPGEFVIRKKAVQAIGLNGLKNMNKYAGGGPVKLKDLERRSGSETIKKAYSSKIQPNDSIRGNINRKSETIKPNDPKWTFIQNNAKQRYLQLKQKSPKASDKKLKDIAAGDAFETGVEKFYGGTRTPQSYPVDIIGRKNPTEVKFTSKKVPILDLLSKLFRYKYQQNTLSRYNFTPNTDDVNIGNLDTIEMGRGQKQKFMQLYPFNNGGIVQKFKKGAKVQELSPQLKSQVEDAGSFENLINRNMIDRQGNYNFGLVSLKSGTSKGGRIENRPIKDTGKRARIHVGALSDNKSQYGNIEKDIVDSLEGVIVNTGKALASSIKATPASGNLEKNILSGAVLSSATGSIFEAALQMVGAPFIDKVESLKSIDFPFGLGTASKLFGQFPTDVPTDATRTSGGVGKGISSFVDQISRFTKAVNKGEFSKSIKLAPNAFTAQNLFDIAKKSPTNQTQLNSVLGEFGLPNIGRKMPKATGNVLDNALATNSKLIEKLKSAGLISANATGGSISGQDTVPALLTPGEFVINKKAAKRIGSSKLHQLNKADKTQGFNKGGAVGNIQSFAGGGGVQSFAAGGMAQVFSGLVSVISKLIPSFNQLSTTTATVTKNMAAQQVATFRQQGLSGAALKAAMVNAGYATGGINNMRSRNQKAANQTANQTNDSGGGLKSLGLMFIGPMIAEAINSSVTKNFGKTGAVVGAGITSVVSGATVGSAFGAPGAIVGAAAGLASAFINAESAADAYTKAQNELKIETESSKLEKALQNLSQNVGDTASNISDASNALMAIMSSGAENRQIVTRESQGLLGLEEGTIGRFIGEFFRDASANFSETYFGTTPETIDTTALNRNLLSESLPQATALQRAIETQLTSGISLEDVFKNLKLTGADANPETKRTLAIARGKDEVTKIEADIAAAETKRYTGGDIRANGTVETAEEEKTRKLEALNAKRAAAIDRLSSEELKEIETRNKNAAAAKAVSVEIDMFAQQIKKLGGVISRADAEFAEAGRLRDIATSSGLGDAKIVGPSRLDENVLGNLTAYSTDELVQALDRTSETLGFSPEFSKQIKTSAVAQQTLESELPRILLEAAQSQKTPGGEVDQSVTDRITEVFDPLKAALGEEIDSTTLDTALKNVVTALGKSATSLQGKSFEEIAASVPELQGLLKPLADVTSTVESSLKAFNDMLSATNNEMNNYTNHLGRILDLQIQASSIELDAANNLKQALGKGVSVTELNRPFENAIDSLTSTQGPNGIVRGTGTLDPEEIARRLAQADKELAQTQAGGQQKGESLDEFYTRLAKNKTTVDRLAKAQEMLANNTTRASNALTRIGELRQAQESRRGTFDEILKNLNNPEWISEFTSQVGSLVRVDQGAGTIYDIGPALEAFRTRIAGMDPLEREAATEKFYNNIINILQKAGLKVDPEVIRGLIGVGGPDAKMTQAIDQYNQAIKAQTDATLLLSERMEDSSEILKTKVIEAADAFLDRIKNAGDLPLEARPVGVGIDGNPANVAGYASRGGMIYASKGQLVNFQPKGTDTVPAMLTPGEFVVNARATKKNMGLLKSINNGSNNTGYSKGGMVYLADGGVIDINKGKQLFSKFLTSSGDDKYYADLLGSGSQADLDAIFKDLRATSERPLGYESLAPEDIESVDAAINEFIKNYEFGRSKAANAEGDKVREARAADAPRLAQLQAEELRKAVNAGIVSADDLGIRDGDYSTASRPLSIDERDKLRQAQINAQAAEREQQRKQEFEGRFAEIEKTKRQMETVKQADTQARTEINPLTKKPFSSDAEKQGVLARQAFEAQQKVLSDDKARKLRLKEETKMYQAESFGASLVDMYRNSSYYNQTSDPILREFIENRIREQTPSIYGTDWDRRRVNVPLAKSRSSLRARIGEIVTSATVEYNRQGRARQEMVAKSQEDFAKKNMDTALQQFGEGVDKSPVLAAVSAVPKNVANVIRTTVGGAGVLAGGLTYGAGKLTGSDMLTQFGQELAKSGGAQAGMGIEGIRQVGSGLGSRLGFGEAYGTAEQEAMKRREALISQEVERASGAYQTDNRTTLGNLLTPENVVRGAITTGDIFGEAAGDIGGEKLFGRLFPNAFKGMAKSVGPRPPTPVKTTTASADLFDNTNVRFPTGASSDIANRTTSGTGTNFANMTANLLDQKASTEFGQTVGRGLGILGGGIKKGFFGGVDLAEKGLAGLQDFTGKALMGTASISGKSVMGAASIAGKGVMGAGKGAMGAARGLLQFEKSPILNSLRKIGVLPKIDWMKKQARKTARAQGAGRFGLGEKIMGFGENISNIFRDRSTRKWFENLQKQQKLSENPLEDLVKLGSEKRTKTTQPIPETPKPITQIEQPKPITQEKPLSFGDAIRARAAEQGITVEQKLEELRNLFPEGRSTIKSGLSSPIGARSSKSIKDIALSSKAKAYAENIPQAQRDAFEALSRNVNPDKQEAFLIDMLEKASADELAWIDDPAAFETHLNKVANKWSTNFRARGLPDTSSYIKKAKGIFTKKGSVSSNPVIGVGPGSQMSTGVHESTHFAAGMAGKLNMTYDELKKMVDPKLLDSFLDTEYNDIAKGLNSAYNAKFVRNPNSNVAGAEFFTTLNQAAFDPATKDLFEKSSKAQEILRQMWKAHGYKKGGTVYASKGTLVPYQPRGTDTVPAMLTPGEFVVNARATKNNLGLLRSINGGAKGYSKGGVAYLQDGGDVQKPEQKDGDGLLGMRHLGEGMDLLFASSFTDQNLTPEQFEYAAKEIETGLGWIKGQSELSPNTIDNQAVMDFETAIMSLIQSSGEEISKMSNIEFDAWRTPYNDAYNKLKQSLQNRQGPPTYILDDMVSLFDNQTPTPTQQPAGVSAPQTIGSKLIGMLPESIRGVVGTTAASIQTMQSMNTKAEEMLENVSGAQPDYYDEPTYREFIKGLVGMTPPQPPVPPIKDKFITDARYIKKADEELFGETTPGKTQRITGLDTREKGKIVQSDNDETAQTEQKNRENIFAIKEFDRLRSELLIRAQEQSLEEDPLKTDTTTYLTAVNDYIKNNFGKTIESFEEFGLPSIYSLEDFKNKSLETFLVPKDFDKKRFEEKKKADAAWALENNAEDPFKNRKLSGVREGDLSSLSLGLKAGSALVGELGNESNKIVGYKSAYSQYKDSLAFYKVQRGKFNYSSMQEDKRKNYEDSKKNKQLAYQQEMERRRTQNMSTGGIVYASKGQLVNYQPRGTDTVPAMLTPGEFVVNRKATRQNLGLLQQINSQNYNTGGMVKPKYFADGGVNGGNISSSGGSSGGVLSIDTSNLDGSFSSFDSIVGQLSGSIQEFVSGGSAIISGFGALDSIVSGFTALSTAAALLGGASTGLTTSIGEFNTAVGRLQSALDGIPDSISLNVTGSIPVNVTVTVNGGQGLGEKLEQFADDIYNTISTELSNKTNGGIKLDLRTSKK